MDYLPHSLFGHAVIAFLIMHMSPVNTSSGEKIEVTIVETDAKVLFPPTPDKPAKQGQPSPQEEKGPKSGSISSPDTPPAPEIDLTEYANQLKVLIDPIWYSNIKPYLGKHFFTEVLIFVDNSGRIKEVKVIKSSGYKEIDKIAVDTFYDVGTLPNPPEIVIKEGIIWGFQAS